MKVSRTFVIVALGFGVGLWAGSASAGEKKSAVGPVLITQSDALAGGITPGDAPGFPVTLSVPGSYLLSDNLTVPAGTAGIEITADNVTLDLNGFGIVGPNTCDGDARTQTTSCTAIFTFDGVFSQKAQITIRNGSIQGMRNGILLLGGPALIEGIHATQNTAMGIRVEVAILRRNTASNNGTDGISATPNSGFTGASIVSDNVAVGNKNNGIIAVGASVTGNASYLNRVGIWATDSTVLENTIRSSVTTGLIVDGSLYGSNTLVNNPTAVAGPPGSVSQGNNNCGGAAC